MNMRAYLARLRVREAGAAGGKKGANFCLRFYHHTVSNLLLSSESGSSPVDWRRTTGTSPTWRNCRSPLVLVSIDGGNPLQKLCGIT